MKRLNRRTAFLIGFLCLFLAIALVVCCVIAVHKPDWIYRIGLRFRQYSEPNLTEILPDEGFYYCSIDDLLKDSRVVSGNALLLVNPERAIPKGMELPISDAQSEPMQPITAEAYAALAAAVWEATGETLILASAYRNAEEQQNQLEASGSDRAALPGHSEHETGLAIDICVVGYGGMSFLKTEAGRFVNDHCGEYGFIIRYPDGKEEVTGFDYEPWHLRYVGAPHASNMMDAGLTLEEYFALLVPDVWYRSGDCYILRTAAVEINAPSDFESCSISEDNLGYRVFTFFL